MRQQTQKCGFGSVKVLRTEFTVCPQSTRRGRLEASIANSTNDPHNVHKVEDFSNYHPTTDSKIAH